jgi:putative N6-adenine-specific DNA methylase
MKFTAKTLYGLENVLAEELKSIGAADVRIANRAVLFSGNKELLYRVNYFSRCALSILVSVSDFSIRSKDDLYKGASGIDWSSVMDPESAFSVVPVVNSKLFDHTGYPGLIVKDAIADYFRNKSGRRPSVDSINPSIVINLHISNDRVNISLDSSVVPLFKRGYRTEQSVAPLNEVLAAGILMLSGWDPSSSLTDPMCGSGTIPIEAGLIACCIPPGKFRQFFGFMKWKNFDEQLFEKVKQEGDRQICKSPVKISGSDISEQAVSQSVVNINNAGLSDQISIEICDFKDLIPLESKDYLVFNPPYGQRLNSGEIDKLYSMIGTTLKHRFAGSKAWIITSGKEYLNNIGLKPKAKYTLFNGALECILAGYELYEGSKKKKGD